MSRWSALIKLILPDYTAWKQHGGTCDSLVAMGIHRASKGDHNMPLWYHELRKQLLAICYCRDKAFSYCLGRPPRLISKFCHTELPLDISMEDLFTGAKDLEDNLASLDAHGWSTKGTAFRETWLRIRVQYCRIREDILDIALGNDEGSDISTSVEKIRRDIRRLPESFPSWISIAMQDVVDRLKQHKPLASSDVHSRSNAISLLSIHLGLSQTEFLLERALINRNLSGRKELIPVVGKILAVVIAMVFARDIL